MDDHVGRLQRVRALSAQDLYSRRQSGLPVSLMRPQAVVSSSQPWRTSATQALLLSGKLSSTVFANRLLPSLGRLTSMPSKP